MPDDAPQTPRVIKRERGYANESTGSGSGWWVDLTGETTPELAWPLSVAIFDKMRRSDSQVKSVLGAIKAPIMRTQWRIDGTGCDRAVTESVARSFGLPIKDDPSDLSVPARIPVDDDDLFSWPQHLSEALLMLPFGHSFFERVYIFDEQASSAVGRDQYLIHHPGPRLPWSIAAIKASQGGKLEWIQQHSAIGFTGANPKIPRTNLVAYVLDREGGNWLGQSLLRSAYKNWLLKDPALRTWSTSIDRNGIGVPLYTDAEKGTPDTMDAGEELATEVRAGENAGGAIAYGAKLELLGVKGTLPDSAEFVRYQDEAIARSALGHFLNLGSQGGGQVGSYNYGSVLADTFNLSLDVTAGLIAASAQSQLVNKLVDINFGLTVAAPRLVYDEIGTRVSELDRVREDTGLTSDADLVKFLRTIPDQEAT